MDSFRAHKTDSVKKELRKANADTAMIPGGCTSVLQPLDVSVNKVFKNLLRKSWVNFIQEEVAILKEDSEHRIRPPSKQKVVDWIGSAMEGLSTRIELIKKSFVVTGISCALNGSDDHHIRKDGYVDAGAYSDTDDEEFEGFTQEDLQVSSYATSSFVLDRDLQ